MTTSRHLLAGSVLTCLLAGPLTGLAPVTAQAAAADDRVAARPAPQDDSYAVYATGAYTFPVLENDDVTFLSNGDLTLCGVTVDDATAPDLYAEIDRTDPTLVYLETSPTTSGEVRFTYDACQGDRRETATVTLTVTRLSEPRVAKKRKRPGRITVRNRNPVDLTIAWGSDQKPVIDGLRTVRARSKTTIKVKRRTVYWAAFVRDQGSVIVIGDGTVRKIKKTKSRG